MHHNSAASNSAAIISAASTSTSAIVIELMGASTSKPIHATNDYELAIKSSKELEYILEGEFEATGKGLHEKITSAANKCPFSPGLVRNMRYLATIRNKLVHERGFDAIPDRKQFIQRFEASQTELKTSIQNQRKGTLAGTGDCVVM